MFLAPVAQPGLRPRRHTPPIRRSGPRARRPGNPSTWISIQEHIYSRSERTPLDQHISGRPAQLSVNFPRGSRYCSASCSAIHCSAPLLSLARHLLFPSGFPLPLLLLLLPRLLRFFRYFTLLYSFPSFPSLFP